MDRLRPGSFKSALGKYDKLTNGRTGYWYTQRRPRIIDETAL